MKQSMRRKRNILIVSLCGVLCIMAAGYALFSSSLNISGTSNITSNWDIEITGIRSGNPEGGNAYDLVNPSYTATTATFKTGLVTPWSWSTHTGSYRVYEIEISNLGSVKGLVTIASLNCGNNDVIECKVIEMKRKEYDDSWNRTFENYTQLSLYGTNDYSDIDFKMIPGEKHYLYVYVWYGDVDKQPENLKADISVELNYEQYQENELSVAPILYTNSHHEGSTYIGDSYKSIPGATTDYNDVVGVIPFLKHTMNGGNVESSELCFVYDNNPYCLKLNDLENSKNTLIGAFGKDSCGISDLEISCNASTGGSVLLVIARDDRLYADFNYGYECGVYFEGTYKYANCFDMYNS